MRRLVRQALGFSVLAVVLFAPSTSFAQQSLNFSFGGFVPTSETSRSDDDVLVNNLCCLENPLAFNVGDFRGATIGAEYLAGLGNFFDAGLGIGYYKRSVPSVYLDLINANGTEIQQDLHLRVVPFSATIRFLPLGHTNAFEPYIGGGLAILNWRYEERGDWVDPSDATIFRGTFVGNGTATGPLILGGVKFPVGPWSFGGEVRWQNAKGDLPTDQEFAGPRIDLGGFTYNAVFSVRF
jgi:hypothetical protein